MKKRGKRRLDYEKSVQVKKSGKKMDKQLTELVEHYDALNDTLLKELPKLSALTEKVGNICLDNMINIQAKWWLIWTQKIRGISGITEDRDIAEIVTNFQRDFKEEEEQVMALGILNQTLKPRPSFTGTVEDSVSTMSRMDSTISNMSRIKSRPSDLGTPRLRASSIASDQPPVLPTPDFVKTPNPPIPMSPPSVQAGATSGGYFYRDYYSGLNSRGPASPASSDFSNPTRSVAPVTTRPGTGRSFDSQGMLSRPSIDSASTSHLRRESNTATSPPLSGNEGQRNSGLFQSALPLTETPEERHRGHSSRGSSRERHVTKGYNVLWLAASLFEFNIETTKHEAGYPYLTYTAGEVCSRSIASPSMHNANCLARSSMSSLRRVNSGLPRTKTTPTILWAGFGRSISPNWPIPNLDVTSSTRATLITSRFLGLQIWHGALKIEICKSPYLATNQVHHQIQSSEIFMCKMHHDTTVQGEEAIISIFSSRSSSRKGTC